MPSEVFVLTKDKRLTKAEFAGKQGKVHIINGEINDPENQILIKFRRTSEFVKILCEDITRDGGCRVPNRDIFKPIYSIYHRDNA